MERLWAGLAEGCEGPVDGLVSGRVGAVDGRAFVPSAGDVVCEGARGHVVEDALDRAATDAAHGGRI